MHIQIVNFNVKDMSEAEFRKMCYEVAPAFASIPGLISKVWLADTARNTFGGVYTWRDLQVMEAFTRSDLFQMVANNPHLVNLNSNDFSVMEGPTRITHGLVSATV